MNYRLALSLATKRNHPKESLQYQNNSKKIKKEEKIANLILNPLPPSDAIRKLKKIF